MQDPWKDRLSEYLDEDLNRSEREAVEGHLRGCAECASTLEDLRGVRARARALKDSRPPADLWPGIEAAIHMRRTVPFSPHREERPARESRPSGRFAFSLSQLIGACLAVALVSGGTVYAVLKYRAGVTPAPRTAAFPAPDTGTVMAAARGAVETPREEAISEIRRVLARGRAKLDPATVRTLESNLAIIEIAIDQAKRALAADPANSYVRAHLAATMKRKVELLQRATILASATNSEDTR